MVKLLVEEQDSDLARGAYESSGVARTAAIGYVEATSALVRMRKGNRLSPTQLKAALAALDQVWDSLYIHAVNEVVIERAAQVATKHALRAYDAIHLAVALAFAEGEQIQFACWDRELSTAASKQGFALLTSP